MKEADCIFCKIAAGEAPSYQVWEDSAHLAFLTPFPNTPGFTVVIPKDHHGSYFAEVREDVAYGLLRAARTVAKKIDAAFKDVGRTGLIFEGFGVDHLHAKLVPMHGTSGGAWVKRASTERRFYDIYPGYIASHDSERADDAELREIAKRIQEAS